MSGKKSKKKIMHNLRGACAVADISGL